MTEPLQQLTRDYFRRFWTERWLFCFLFSLPFFFIITTQKTKRPPRGNCLIHFSIITLLLQCRQIKRNALEFQLMVGPKKRRNAGMKSQHSTSQSKQTKNTKRDWREKREKKKTKQNIELLLRDGEKTMTQLWWYLTVTSRRRIHLSHKNSSNAASHKDKRNELTRFSICLQ